MSTYSTTFSGQTTGSNPTNFTNRYDTETAVSVENPAIGEQDNRVLQFGTGDSGDIFQSFDDVDGDANRDNCEMLANFRVTADVASEWSVRGRASGSAGSETYYEFRCVSGAWNIRRTVSGGSVSLVSVNADVVSDYLVQTIGDTYTNTPADQWLWVRFRINGTGATVTLQAKIWPEGYREPDAWVLEYDDTSASRITSAGWCGFGKLSFSGTTYLDVFSVGTNGDTAPFVASTDAVRVTQINASVMRDPSPAGRVTQINASVMQAPEDDLRITTFNASVMYSPPAAPGASGAQSVSCIINC